MKHLKLFAIMAIIGASLTGCTKEYVTYENGSQVKTHEYTVTPNKWTRNQGTFNPGADNYLYATFENSDITADVMNNGTVTADVWAIYDFQNNLGSWHPLPYVYPLEVYETNDQGVTSMVIAPENLRFEWNEGEVTFIIQDLDGYDPEEINSTLQIRINVISNMR